MPTMEINQGFKELLLNLQNSDNECRNEAESTYETIEFTLKLEYLLQVIGDQETDVAMRVFSAVLCRRLLDSNYKETFSSLTPEIQSFTKQRLLSWILCENDIIMKKKICEIVVEVAKEQFDDFGNLKWGELIVFIFDGCLSSSNPSIISVGLQLFCSLPQVLGEKLHAHMDSLCAIFARCMAATDVHGVEQSSDVREAAVKALSSLIVCQINETDNISAIVPLISLMLQTTADSIIAEPDNDTCMKALIELADSGSNLLKYAVNEVLYLCNNILHNEVVNESQKHLAVELFVSLTENCPGAVRKCSVHLQSLMKMLFKMLTDLEDDPEWATLDVEDEGDETTSSIVAEMALDRVACAMRGKKVLQEFTLIVPAMLHSSKWQDRHGGLMAISSCAEGLNKVMGEILGSIIDEIVPLLMDPHPRVRYAACNAVGQLSTDFGNKLQKMYHAKVLPALLSVLDDDLHPRVQSYAGAAMVNFCEAAPKSVVLYYLPQLTEKLLYVLRKKYNDLLINSKKLVLEQIVTTIAAVADSVAEHFAPYYEDFMTFLKFLMKECQVSTELRLLRGKTIECISLMGLAVGRERFLNDAQEVMGLLIKYQTVDTESEEVEDPQHSYIISAWARMCKILGKDFAEFLPLVMDSVLKTANIKPDVCMLYNDETEDVDKDWHVVKIADNENFAIHTSGIDDKATACQMLVCYARELSESFSPYVMEVAEIMIPLLKFYFNEEVRSSAADILPHLLECSRPLGPSVTSSLWKKILTALLRAIPREPYREQIADMLDSLAEGIKKMGREAISNETIPKLVDMMTEQFGELFKNQETRLQKRRTEEYDEDDEERLDADKDDDDHVLCKLVDLMHALFIVYREEAVHVFEELLPQIRILMQSDRPWTDLQYGLCFWDDMIETMGCQSWRYAGEYLPVMISGLSHNQKEIRQASIYGFGLMAMYGGEDFVDVLKQVAPLLVVLVEDDVYSRGEEMNMSTENAISALGKIIKFRGAECVPGGDMDSFLVKWLRWLPVWEDVEETGHVYGLVCDLVDGNCPVVLEANILAHIVRSISFCWHKEGMSEEGLTYGRCVTFLRAIQTSDNDFFNSCVAALSKAEADTLQKVLS